MASNKSTIKVSEFLSLFDKAAEKKNQTTFGNAVEFGIYQCIEAKQAGSGGGAAPYDPFPVNRWQNYTNLCKSTPDTLASVEEKVKKMKKGADGKRVFDGYVVEKPRLKKIVTAHQSLKTTIAFLVSAMGNEAIAAMPEIEKMKNQDTDSIKNKLCEVAMGMQNGFHAVTPLILAISEHYENKVIDQVVTTQHRLHTVFSDCMMNNVRNDAVLTVLSTALNKVIKIFCIARAARSWQDTKESSGSVDIEEKEKAAAAAKAAKASATETKKSGKKKAKVDPDNDDEKELVGVGKQITGSHLREFLDAQNYTAATIENRVNINEIFISMQAYEEAFNAYDEKRKERNRELKEEKKKTKSNSSAATKADAPKADAPKADAPKADAPKADAPKVEEKKAEAAPATAAATPAAAAPAAAAPAGVAVAATEPPAAAPARGRRRG